MIRILAAATVLLMATSALAQQTTSAAGTPAAKAPVAVTEMPTTSTKPFIYTPKPSDVVIGKKDVPVVIVEYASLSCPHCGHFYTNVLPDLTKKYIDSGKAKLVYRDYPLNAPAMSAAKLVQCADPDRRHAFIKVLFTTQQKWVIDPGKESLAGIAALGGIDRPAFNKCMEDKAIEKTIYTVAKEAQDDYKVNSTPTFFINGKMKSGDHDLQSMSDMIDKALADSAKK